MSPDDVAQKVEALAARIAGLQGELAHLQRAADEARLEAGVIRSALGLALAEALAARAAADAARRDAVAELRLQRLSAARSRPAVLRGRAGRSDPPLFDAGWYERAYLEGHAARGGTYRRYLADGMAKGRDPHPLFSVRWYLGQGADPAPGETPAAHYLRQGWRDGLSPHPLFDPAWYLGQASEASEGPPLLHYLETGWRRGARPHPLFDPAWYLEQNPDVASAGVEPLGHFIAAGAAEGRSPGPWFDLPHYVGLRGAALPAGANPLVDYLQGGAWAVSEARPGLSTTVHLVAHPELAASGLTPLEHWARQAQA